MQRTLVLIKPDAVQQGVWLDIIKFYEKYGLTPSKAVIFPTLPQTFAEKLYAEHKGKDFYGGLIWHMTTQGPVIALMFVGHNVIALVRALNGATRPAEAEEGTIRHKYGLRDNGPANAVHGSANPADAERELEIIFGL